MKNQKMYAVILLLFSLRLKRLKSKLRNKAMFNKQNHKKKKKKKDMKEEVEAIEAVAVIDLKELKVK